MALANVISPPDAVEDIGVTYLNNLSWSGTSSSSGNNVYYASVKTYDVPIKSVSIVGWGSIGDWVIPYIGSNGKTVGLMVKSTTWIVSSSWVGLRVVT